MSNSNNYLFGTKELYEVALKTTSKMEINGKIIEKGETIALFDKIQIANFNEIKNIVTANGGFDNRAWVTWESTKALDLYFTQGIFSKVQFALLSNSKLITQGENSITYVPFHEVVESDENGKVLFSYLPSADKPIFIYNENGDKVTSNEGNSIQIAPEYIEITSQKINELLSLDVELPDSMFSLDELDSLGLTMEEVNAFFPLIQD